MAGPDGRVEVVRGDITKVRADALINAANRALAGGGGVDGAVHRVGGPSIAKQLLAFTDGCPPGKAVVTKGGELPVQYVIHAVGPIWRGGGQGEAATLSNAYRSAFALAKQYECRLVTSAAISCGIYGYPPAPAALIAINEAYAAIEAGVANTIQFCVVNDAVEAALLQALAQFQTP